MPFIIAIVIGGEFGANISDFLYKQFYPWVIIIGCVAVLVGLVAMYVGKVEGLSVKKPSGNKKSVEGK